MIANASTGLWVRLHACLGAAPAYLAFGGHQLEGTTIKGLRVVNAQEDFGLVEARALLPQDWSLFDSDFRLLYKSDHQYERLELACSGRHLLWLSLRSRCGKIEARSGTFTLDDLSLVLRVWRSEPRDIFALGAHALDTPAARQIEEARLLFGDCA